MKSLSEIETTSKRASKAAGFSWGVSEEIAKGIRLLELFGLPGVKNLNHFLKKKNSQNYEKLIMIKKKNKPNLKSFCPINTGLAFLDNIQKIQNFKKINFTNISYPVLFLPFLSRSSEIIGKKISFKFEKNFFLFNFNVNILLNTQMKEFPLIAKKAEVSFLENRDSFTEKDWKNLYKLSENIFVRETESLKKEAAGAGLTDND